jgi:chemotaxis protein methyltransferase CheR
MKVASQHAITDDDFKKFREYFYRKTGMYFDDGKRYFVDKRLQERIAQTDSASFLDYFVMLRFQATGGELQQLINTMTVNETYFFREEYHFACLVKSMLPEITANKKDKDPIRIWSMQISQYDVDLMASDIDTDILKQASLGRFSRRSVQNLPAHLKSQYFREQVDGDYQLIDDLRQSVEFTRANLTELADTRRFRKVDVIFCRNLLIYFDDESRRQAAEAFYDALNPGGFICLGHSESMSRISGLFNVRKFPDAIVYQKPFASEKNKS